MKQNERLLVYAVTGFLAIILLVAVLFGPSGRDAAAKSSGGDATNPTSPKNDGPRGLGELLGDKAIPKPVTEPKAGSQPAASPETPPAPVKVADVLQSNPVATQQPLVANERPLVAMDMVAQVLGTSRRDRSVRMVRAKSGDSLDTLVRRWCGARDPFLEEAKALNEDLVTLRVGQEICVPWVDDEIVLAAYEATKPKTLVPTTLTPPPGPTTGGAETTPAPVVPQARPSFAEPGVARTESNLGKESGKEKAAGKTPANVPAAPASGTEYVVKAGESLWKIADRTYGRQNAPKMIAEIKKANPSLGDTLRAGQKIVLPAAK